MKRFSKLGGDVVSYGLLTLAALVFLYPLWWAVSSSFKMPASIITEPLTVNPLALTLGNYHNMFEDVPLGTGFFNTTIVILFKGALTLVFCPLAGFAFAKYSFPGKEAIFSLVLLTLTLPVLVLIIPLLLEMKTFGWLNSYQALILPGAVDAFAIFWMRQTISAVPSELLDAARIDGASELTLYRTIVLPVIRPGLSALGVLTFMNIYNDFVWPVVAINTDGMQTLQVVLSNLSQNITGNRITADFATVWGELLAASSLAMLPVLVVFIALQRHFINGILAGSVKG